MEEEGGGTLVSFVLGAVETLGVLSGTGHRMSCKWKPKPVVAKESSVLNGAGGRCEEVEGKGDNRNVSPEFTASSSDIVVETTAGILDSPVSGVCTTNVD